MQLVGYVVFCRDHGNVVVAPIKPTEQDKGWHGFIVYTSTDEIYSTAVKCHAKGVPAVFEVKKEGIDKERLVATDIGPIDLTEDDVNDKLQSLTTSGAKQMSDKCKNNEAVCIIVNHIIRICEDIRDCLCCCSDAGAVQSIYDCQIDRIKTDFNCITKLTGDAKRYLPTENQYPN